MFGDQSYHYNIREAMCDLLQLLISNPISKAAIEWISGYLFVGGGNGEMSLEQYAEYERKDGNYAGRGDAILCSKLLNRPIVFVYPTNNRKFAELFLPTDDWQVVYHNLFAFILIL